MEQTTEAPAQADQNQTTTQETQQSQSPLPTEPKFDLIASLPPRVPLRHLSGLANCISRPQYQRTCGTSSLVSIFNYQFSTLGIGKLPPISLEEALLKLNIIGKGSISDQVKKYTLKKKEALNAARELGDESEKPQSKPEKQETEMTLSEVINEVDFGIFTGNEALMKWYRILCRVYGVSGRSYYFYKTSGKSTKTQNTEEQAKHELVDKLVTGKTCFIYHAHDHYFCPVGYEIVPSADPQEGEQFAPDVQRGVLSDKTTKLWVLVGETSKFFPLWHTFDWDDVQKDMTTYLPYSYNIRRNQMKTLKIAQDRHGSTINCIMAFEKLRD